MAQGRVSGGVVGASKKLTDRDAYEMQQYEKIVRFQEAVLSGTHPTVKLPRLDSALAQPPAGLVSTAAQARADDAHQSNLQSSSTADAKKTNPRAVSFAGACAAPAPPPIPKPLATRKTEFNPILLEKSDELVRAEIVLQRQRLERALREEVEQRRFAKIPQFEHHPDLDLSDVLTRALEIVPAMAASSSVEDLAANRDAASDSFDDNTFYSSQHDTPHSHMTSRVRNESEEAAQGSKASHKQLIPAPRTVDETRQQRAPAVADSRAAEAAPTNADRPCLPANTTTAMPRASIVPGLNNYAGDGGNVPTQPSRNTARGERGQYEDSSGNKEPEPSGAAVAMKHTQQVDDSYIDNHPPSPLIRGHTLQPVAPQPAQISPLAVSGYGSEVAIDPLVQRTRGTPAQVAALRSEHATVTSPDSSSQGGRGSDKKKGRKKKRKAGRQAPEVEANPYIKAEPRSQSPMAAPSYVRASKRQRQSRAQVIELDYEPKYERPLVHGPDGQYLTRQYRDEHVPLGHGSAGAYAQRAVSTAALIGDPRYSREYLDDRRLPADGHIRGYGLPSAVPPPPPLPPALPYSPGVAYSPRPVSQTFASGGGYGEPSRPFREWRERSRLSVRPEGDAFTGQPKAIQSRMVVDAFGREYFDPAHPAVQRPTVPSVGPAGEAGVVYERMPSRAVSRHGGAEVYREGGVVYGVPPPPPPPPPYAMPRRIVTQPAAEYASYDYRDGPHREYLARPMARPGDFVEVGGAQERRHVNEGPMGYATRGGSMMPVETVRYEVPPQGYGRVQSVRPDGPGREFAASMHAEGRREAVQPYLREYAVEAYHRPQGRGADEIAFIERPRGATQEIVYADDARREIYHRS